MTLSVGEAKTDNAMWTKDPDQKLCYSGAIRWARRHCPQVLLGIIAEDEPQSLGATPLDTTPLVPAGNLDPPQRTAAAKPEHSQPAAPIDLEALVQELAGAIEAAASMTDLSAVTDRIHRELAISEADRQTLRAMYRTKRTELTEKAS